MRGRYSETLSDNKQNIIRTGHFKQVLAWVMVIVQLLTGYRCTGLTFEKQNSGSQQIKGIFTFFPVLELLLDH